MCEWKAREITARSRYGAHLWTSLVLPGRQPSDGAAEYSHVGRDLGSERVA